RRIERSEHVNVLNRRQIEFVAQTQIQSQLGRDLPIVLEVITRTEGLRVVERFAQISIALSRNTEQEVGDRTARESPVEIEASAPDGSEEGMEEEARDAAPDFLGGRAADEGHVLDVMIGVVVPALRQIGRPAESGEARDDGLGRAVVEWRAARV